MSEESTNENSGKIDNYDARSTILHLHRALGESLQHLPSTQNQEAIRILARCLTLIKDLNNQQTPVTEPDTPITPTTQAYTDTDYPLSDKDKLHERGLNAYGTVVNFYNEYLNSSYAEDKEEVGSRFSDFCEKLDPETFVEMADIYNDEIRLRVNKIKSIIRNISQENDITRKNALIEDAKNITNEINQLVSFWLIKDEKNKKDFYIGILNKLLLELNSENISNTNLYNILSEIISRSFSFEFLEEKPYRPYNLEKKQDATEQEMAIECFKEIDSTSLKTYIKGRKNYLEIISSIKRDSPQIYKEVRILLLRNIMNIISKISEEAKSTDFTLAKNLYLLRVFIHPTDELIRKFKVFLGSESESFREISMELNNLIKEAKNYYDSTDYTENFNPEPYLKKIKDILIKSGIFN